MAFCMSAQSIWIARTAREVSILTLSASARVAAVVRARAASSWRLLRRWQMSHSIDFVGSDRDEKIEEEEQ